MSAALLLPLVLWTSMCLTSEGLLLGASTSGGKKWE